MNELVIVLAIVGFIVAVLWRKTVTKAIKACDQARLDYLNGLHALPKVITAAAEKDTYLTETNRILSEKINLLTEEAVTNAKAFADLSAHNSRLYEEVESYSERLTELETQLEDSTFVLDGFRSSITEIKNTPTEVPKEVVEAITEVLFSLRTPVNAYECGVHNGVVAIANVLYPSMEYAFIPPIKEVQLQRHSIRGAGGKFTKKAT